MGSVRWFVPSLVFDPKKMYLGRISKNNITGPTMAASLELEKNTLGATSKAQWCNEIKS